MLVIAKNVKWGLWVVVKQIQAQTKMQSRNWKQSCSISYHYDGDDDDDHDHDDGDDVDDDDDDDGLESIIQIPKIRIWLEFVSDDKGERWIHYGWQLNQRRG